MHLEPGTNLHEILSAPDVSVMGAVYRALVVAAFLSLAGTAPGEPPWGLEMALPGRPANRLLTKALLRPRLSDSMPRDEKTLAQDPRKIPPGSFI